MRCLTSALLWLTLLWLLLYFFAVPAPAQIYIFGQASFATGAKPGSAIAADLNNDGRLDIVTSNRDSNSITILLGKPDGTFAPGVDYFVGQGPTALGTGDFNGDGILDLAVTNGDDSTVSILVGNGDGTFQSIGTLPLPGAPTALAVGDFNRDGIPDLALATGSSPATVSIFLGNGDASFQSRGNLTTEDFPAALAVADFNSDGMLDLAVANHVSGTVSIWKGNGDGTFQPYVDYASGKGPVSLTTGDFNRDGIVDLIVANSVDQTASLLLGSGDGTFQNPRSSFLGFSPVALVTGDFNGDRQTDVVLVGTSNSQFRLRLLAGNGDGTFRSQPPVPLNTQPGSICSGDFNGDGAFDLALANPDSNSMAILINDGKGTFRSYTEYSTNGDARSVIAGDFNNDGVPDLATNSATSNSVSVLLGNGDGSFRSHTDYSVAGPAAAVVTADFNLDGRLDLAVPNDISSGSISILPGAGDGTFLARLDQSVGKQLQWAATGDFNGDGRPDLVLTNGGPAPFTISVLLGNGDETFRAAASYLTGLSPRPAVVGDFNGDGRLDIAVGNTSSETVSIFLGNGDGTFQGQLVYPTAPGLYSMVAGDFNGDGKLDLATANINTNTVSVLLGNGDGTFQNHVDYPTGKFTLAITTGDLNGDGKLDLAVSNLDANTVSILLGNGDGTFQPRIDYATGNGPEGGITGDFNRDGGLDFAVTARFDSAVSIFLNTPVISCYPSHVTFVDRPVGTSSPPETVLLSNPGSMPLKIQSVATSGDFSQTNACGSTMAVGANCQINLTFTPNGSGVRTGTLIINDNLTSSPQFIVLTGKGISSSPVASLSVSRLIFAGSDLGAAAPAQMVTLTNTGNAALSLANIRIDGIGRNDFSQLNDCGNLLNPQENCIIAVNLTPTAISETANLVITDNADDTPQRVSLIGITSAFDATFFPARLAFPSQPVRTTSASSPVTITFNGAANLSIQSVSTTGDFAEVNNCFTLAPASRSCTINVTFTPAAVGDRGGDLIVQHNGLKTVVGLAGLGGDFTLSATTTVASISAGQTANYTSPLLTPIAGFNKTVTLTCTGVPAGTTCFVNPSISLNGLTPFGFTVSVSTTARSLTKPRMRIRLIHGLPDVHPPSMLVGIAFLLALYGFRRRQRTGARQHSITFASLLLLVLVSAACGGGGGVSQTSVVSSSNSGTPAGAYTLTITGTYTSDFVTITHSMALTLNVT